MAHGTAARLGGIGGILFVLFFFRSYLTPPDAPIPTSGPEDVIGYFTDRQDGILLFNGLLLIFAAFFFLWFVGTLHGVLRSAEGEGGGFSSVALAGGLVFITLVLAGAASRSSTRPPSTVSRTSRPTPSSGSSPWCSRDGCTASPWWACPC